jgi:hypothetical protein
MQKKGKKGTWDGSVPHSISFHHPKLQEFHPKAIQQHNWHYTHP